MITKEFRAILLAKQGELFSLLAREYIDRAIINDDSYIAVEGNTPIMLIAHLDTVHSNPVRDICVSEDNNIIMSPQGIGGDDRCGVYALLKLHEISKIKPFLLFCCDEEIGGYGAHDFASDYKRGIFPADFTELKCLVEFDRRGKKDAVYYECDNKQFEKYITSKGFRTAHGSFSDISVIAPVMGVAAVNLSCGYYNAHSQHEYIKMNELNAIIKKASGIIEDVNTADFPRYKYIAKKHFEWYEWHDDYSSPHDYYSMNDYRQLY